MASGYTDCACGGCFEIAVSSDTRKPDLCADCKQAGCSKGGDSCDRSDDEETPAIRMRVYVGPVQVAHFAERLRAIGCVVTCEGTENVYFTLPGTPDHFAAIAQIQDRLKDRYGSDGGLRAVDFTSFGG